MAFNRKLFLQPHIIVTAWLACTAACSLPMDAKNACLSQSDCLAGYSCLNQACTSPVPGPQDTGGASTGSTAGGVTGGTTGSSWTHVTPVSSEGLVTCADPNALAALPHSNGPATHIDFVIEPMDVAVNGAMCPVAVAALDDAGAIVTTNSATMSLTSSSQALTGGVVMSATQGVAVFSNLRVTTVGTRFTLSAQQGNTTATSTAFATHAVSWSQIANWDWQTYIAYDNGDNTLYGYSYVGAYRSKDGGATWSDSNNIWYNVPMPGVQSPAAVFVNNNGPAISTDDGLTNTMACGNLDPNTCAGISPIAVDLKTGALVAGNTQYMYASTDRGVTWRLVVDLGTPTGTSGFSNVAVSDDILYASQIYTHALIVSDNFSSNLAYLTVSPAEPNAIITGLAVDPRDANTVYVSATDGLFVSHDRGQTYAQPISGCASKVAAATVGDSTYVYATLNDCLAWNAYESPTPGFIASTDGGLTWHDNGWGLLPAQPDNYRGAGPTACNTAYALDRSGNGSVYLSLGWCGGVYHSASGGVN